MHTRFMLDMPHTISTKEILSLPLCLSLVAFATFPPSQKIEYNFRNMCIAVFGLSNGSGVQLFVDNLAKKAMHSFGFARDAVIS